MVWYGKEEYEGPETYSVKLECTNCGIASEYRIKKGVKWDNDSTRCNNCGVIKSLKLVPGYYSK